MFFWSLSNSADAFCSLISFSASALYSAAVFSLAGAGAGAAGFLQPVTQRRTKKDYAQCLRKLLDQMYPDAEVIVVVQDNLNTHSPASWYEVFAPAQAQRLAARFEFHYTPKHGRWPDMAEIELGILGRQCLSQRIDNIEDLRRQVKA
jgi:hypothetical protein